MENTIIVNGITGEVFQGYTEIVEINEPFEIDYKTEVERLIAIRYTQGDENAIQRKYLFDKSNEVEFIEYHNYVEACKEQVREIINNSRHS